MDATDYWTGIRAHNNLSIGWACDQMLALYRLTGDDKWLRHGEHLLSILSFYQQVWNPSHRSGYLYGGFGGLPDGSYTVGVNGAACENRSASELSAGIAVRITA